MEDSKEFKEFHSLSSDAYTTSNLKQFLQSEMLDSKLLKKANKILIADESENQQQQHKDLQDKINLEGELGEKQKASMHRRFDSEIR